MVALAGAIAAVSQKAIPEVSRIIIIGNNIFFTAEHSFQKIKSQNSLFLMA
jgi:hypothetical protein